MKTFLPEKCYGFIDGVDGKSYFFHASDFRDQADVERLCDGILVDFDQKATPKGYRACRCHLPEILEVMTYSEPDTFIAAKSSSVSGWEMIEGGQWVVIGTSRDSPDAAMRDAKGKAFQQLGANALLNMTYYKSTGSEAGTGRGTHYFTIHHYRGIAVTLAKKDINGQHQLDDLKGLNRRAKLLKQRLMEKSKRDSWLGGLGLSILFVISVAINPFIGLIATIAAGIALRDWIKKNDWLHVVGSR